MKRTLCVILIVFLLISVVSITAYADVMIAGTRVGGICTITGNGVNFREGPGTGYDSQYSLNYGESGGLTHAYPSYPNPEWYRIRMTSVWHFGKIGWVSSGYVSAPNVALED